MSSGYQIDLNQREEGLRLTFATSKVRFIRTLNESDDPVEETVWTFRTAMALTSSPFSIQFCSTTNQRCGEAYLGDQVIDMPHIFIVLRTERDVPLLDQLPG